MKRYVRLIGNMACGSYGTLDDLFRGELASWKRLGYRSTPVEYVDTWTEPGRFVNTLPDRPREHGCLVWEPGESFPDDDNTVLRFRAMEMT